MSNSIFTITQLVDSHGTTRPHQLPPQADEWRVIASYDDPYHGTMFRGPRARIRAEDYVAWMNGKEEGK